MLAHYRYLSVWSFECAPPPAHRTDRWHAWSSRRPHPSTNGLYGYGGARGTSQEGEDEQLHRSQTPALEKKSQHQNCDLSDSPEIPGKLLACLLAMPTAFEEAPPFSEKVQGKTIDHWLGNIGFWWHFSFLFLHDFSYPVLHEYAHKNSNSTNKA